MAWGGAEDLGGSPDHRALFPLFLERGGKRGLAKELLEPKRNNKERDLSLGKMWIVAGKVREIELKKVETNRCGGKDH